MIRKMVDICEIQYSEIVRNLKNRFQNGDIYVSKNFS